MIQRKIIRETVGLGKQTYYCLPSCLLVFFLCVCVCFVILCSTPHTPSVASPMQSQICHQLNERLSIGRRATLSHDQFSATRLQYCNSSMTFARVTLQRCNFVAAIRMVLVDNLARKLVRFPSSVSFKISPAPTTNKLSHPIFHTTFFLLCPSVQEWNQDSRFVWCSPFPGSS